MDIQKQFELYRDAYVVDHPYFNMGILCKTIDFDSGFQPLPKLYDGTTQNRWAMPAFIPTFSRVFECNPLAIEPNIKEEEPRRDYSLEKLLDLFIEPMINNGVKFYVSNDLRAMSLNHKWFRVMFISENTDFFKNKVYENN